MWKLAFSYIPVEGWVIDPDVHGLLDGSSDTMCLPAYNNETVHTVRMPHGLALLEDEVVGFEMFFEPLPKDPFQFADILLLLPFCLGASVPVDYPTF